MAHERKRHVQELYQQHLSFNPIVGVFGHRQVGKSTFIAHGAGKYLTLDDETLLKQALKDAKKFISDPKKHPIIIDECQLAPSLFPALKEWVRVHKKPGQFTLSGSVRFTSRKAIRESLAGRMGFFEMLPLSTAEINDEPLPNTIPILLSSNQFSGDSLMRLRNKNELIKAKKTFEKYLTHGGLPGLCFIRTPQHQIDSLNFLLQLILDRDLRLVTQTKLSVFTIQKFLSLIAKNTWNQYNASDVKRELGLSPITQKSLLYAMESIFLIRRIPLKGKKGEIILLEDQLEELILSNRTLSQKQQEESAVYRNIRTQFAYKLGAQVTYESYLTRDNARVPLILHSQQSTLGIIIIDESEPSISEKRSANSFLSKFVNSKILYLSQDIISPRVINEKSLLTSIYSAI